MQIAKLSHAALLLMGLVGLASAQQGATQYDKTIGMPHGGNDPGAYAGVSCIREDPNFSCNNPVVLTLFLSPSGKPGDEAPVDVQAKAH